MDELGLSRIDIHVWDRGPKISSATTFSKSTLGPTQCDSQKVQEYGSDRET